MLKSVKKNVAKHAHLNWALFDQALLSGVNFVIGFLVARNLGLEEYGRFALGWLVVLFFASIQQSSIISPMMSTGPKLDQHKRSDYYGAVAIHLFAWCFVCTTLLISGYFFAQFSDLIHGYEDIVFSVAVATVGFQVQDFVRRYYFSIQSSRQAFLNDLLCYGGQLIALMVGFNYFRMDSESVLLTIGTVSFSSAIVSFRAFASLNYSVRRAISIGAEHWGSAKWMTGASLVQWTAGNYFIAVLGVVAGPTLVGALRAAQNVMGVTHILFLGLENIVPGGASRVLQEKGKEALGKYLVKWGGLCFCATLIFCASLSINPNGVMREVFGNDYADYGYLLLWYAPVYLLTSLGLALRSGLRAVEMTRAIFFANAIAALFSLSTATFIVNQSGLVGVMIGLVLTQLIIQATTFLSVYRNIWQK